MNIIRITSNNFSTWEVEWENFIQEHPSGSVFQSPWYYQVFAGNRSTKPLAMLLVDAGHRVTGVLLSVIQYQLPLPLRFLTARSVIIGGPVVQNNDAELAGLLLAKYNGFIRNRVIYSQIRNIADLSPWKNAFKMHGYGYEEHLNLLIDLTKPVEELWQELHTKRRNEIRKAEKSGLEFRSMLTADEFRNSYKILQRLYSGIRLPIYNSSVFQSTRQKLVPKGIARIFGVFYEGTLVGTMYTFCYKGTVHNWFAGSDSAYYKHNPNDFLPWNIFLWSKENGFTTFDWGGAGKPDVPYGVRDYKAKFGGKFVNFGRFEKVHKPWLFYLAKSGFRMWQKMKI